MLQKIRKWLIRLLKLKSGDRLCFECGALWRVKAFDDCKILQCRDTACTECLSIDPKRRVYDSPK